MTGFILPDRLQWEGCRLLRRGFGGLPVGLGRDTKESDGLVASQVIGGDDIGAVHAGDPDVLRRLRAAAGKSVGQPAHDAAADGKGQLEWRVDQGGEEGAYLHADAGGSGIGCRNGDVGFLRQHRSQEQAYRAQHDEGQDAGM